MNATQSAVAGGEVLRPAGSLRSPLQRMLHALKQPVTGLHCSLELALAGPRTPDEQLRTLREGMGLAERMSVLVAAIGELVESEEANRRAPGLERLSLEQFLGEAADELRPVAETKPVLILLQCEGPLPVYASRLRIAAAVFRLLDSALSLARAGSELRVNGREKSGEVFLEVRWEARDADPFSRPELGLLLAEAAWVSLGGDWARRRSEEQATSLHTIVARLRVASHAATYDALTLDALTLPKVARNGDSR